MKHITPAAVSGTWPSGIRHAASPARGGRPSALRRCALLAALAVMAGGASAQITPWINPAIGNWAIPGNWYLGNLPQAGSWAQIENGGLAFIDSAGAAAGWLTLGDSRSDGLPGYLTVSGAGSLSVGWWIDVENGALEIRGGAQVIVLDTNHNLGVYPHTELGGYYGGTGTLLVSGANTYLRSFYLTLGSGNDANSKGFLTLADGARIDSTDVTTSLGTATVTGRNSVWAVSGGLALSGNNSLVTVASAGTINAAHMTIDYGSAVNLTGAGSSVNTSGYPGSADLFVGLNSAGALTVQNGARMASARATVGAAPTATGQVLVTGTGSAWINSGLLEVGGYDDGSPYWTGTGTVKVQSGGLLSTGAAHIGSRAHATGTVTLEGPNSRWSNSGDVLVGNAGSGTLIVNGGAKITSLRGHVGFAAGSDGNVNVTGPGSSWTASGSLFIGNAGNGRLTVLDGAVVSTAGNSYLGFAPGAAGTVSVSGPGSTWNMTAPGTNLNIGGSQAGAGGTGVLGISNSGVVNALATRLYNTGTLVLVGDATLNGPLSADGGLLRSWFDTRFAGAITLQAGGLRLDTLSAATVITLDGNIGGPGGLTHHAVVGAADKGTLILSGSNTYLGATTVNSGTLRVNGSNAGPVNLNAGTLGGTGLIGGAVVIGDQLGTADAVLAPGASPGTLSTGDLTIRADGVVAFQIDSQSAVADRIVVTGFVELDPAASFHFLVLGTAALAPGLSFVAIDNDGVDPIVGRFKDLAEGLVFVDGANQYRVSYFGGTGNDLSIGVVPEPASAALLLAGLLAVWGATRRGASVH